MFSPGGLIFSWDQDHPSPFSPHSSVHRSYVSVCLRQGNPYTDNSALAQAWDLAGQVEGGRGRKAWEEAGREAGGRRQEVAWRPQRITA